MVGLFIGFTDRTDHALDEFDLILRDAVLLVKVGIGPDPVPRLHRRPPIHAAKDVLGWLPERHEESRESRSQIGLDTLCLSLRLQRARNQIGLGTDRPWLAN